MTALDADVVVIGAGLAGLRCARSLTESGLTAIVLEAGPEVGGRVGTDTVDGFRCDRGFQLFNPAYPAVRRWVDVAALGLQQFGAGVLVRRDTGLKVLADPRREPALLPATLASGLLSPRDLAALARWVGPVLANPRLAKTGSTKTGSTKTGSTKTGSTKTGSSEAGLTKTGSSEGGDDRSLREALDEAGAGGPLRTVLERFLAGVLAESQGATSADFVRLLLRSFLLGTPGLPFEGMAALPRQLAEGLDVRLEAPASSLERDGGEVRVDGAVPVRARAAVVAVAGQDAGALVDAAPVATKGLVTWWFSASEAPDARPLLAVDGRGTSLPGPVVNAAVVSNAAPSYAPRRAHLVQATTLLDRPDGDAPESAVKAHLAELYGVSTTGWQVVVRHRIEHALPAQPAPLRLRRPVQVGERVLLCGDHRDSGSIQGALVSGERAARAAVGLLG